MRSPTILLYLACSLLVEAAPQGLRRRCQSPFQVSSSSSAAISSSVSSSSVSAPSASVSGVSINSNTTEKTNVVTNRSSVSLDGHWSSNGVGVGYLPEDSTSNIPYATTAGYIDTQSVPYVFGIYTQVYGNGKGWDQSQLSKFVDQIKGTNMIVEVAVMPDGGFNCSWASPVCTYLKEFMSETGIPELRCRYGHEVNWYTSSEPAASNDQQYNGTSDEYKTCWAAFAQECQPDIKMFYSPNIADLATYEEWMPTDPATIDYIGVDWYPTSADQATTAQYLSNFQAFHDQYTAASNNSAYSHIQFATGETAVSYDGCDETCKIDWLKQIVAAKSSMSQLVSVDWFNYDDMAILASSSDGSSLKSAFEWT